VSTLMVGPPSIAIYDRAECGRFQCQFQLNFLRPGNSSTTRSFGCMPAGRQTAARGRGQTFRVAFTEDFR